MFFRETKSSSCLVGSHRWSFGSKKEVCGSASGGVILCTSQKCLVEGLKPCSVSCRAISLEDSKLVLRRGMVLWPRSVPLRLHRCRGCVILINAKVLRKLEVALVLGKEKENYILKKFAFLIEILKCASVRGQC